MNVKRTLLNRTRSTLISRTSDDPASYNHEMNPYDPPEPLADEESRENSFTEYRMHSDFGIGCLLFLAVIQLRLLAVAMVLVAFNFVFGIVFLARGSQSLGGIAFLGSILYGATVVFSDWGFSTPNPIVNINWFVGAPATVTMFAWILIPLIRLR